MRKLLDIKSFIIGILTAIICVLTLGTVNKKEGYYDQITTKNLAIVNDNGEMVGLLSSGSDGGQFTLLNNKMEEKVSLNAYADGSNMKMNSKRGNANIYLNCRPYISSIYLSGESGKSKATLHTAYNVGSLFLYNKKDMLTIDATGGYTGANEKGQVVEMPHEGGGIIQIRNRHFKKVVRLQANKNDDGIIALFDRYGEYGWGQTGKR